MPAKHAVIIGVNKYSNLDKKYELAGCVNDALLIKNVLVEHFNFDEANIRELHDEEASQQAIFAEMDRLVDVARKDDIVVFHFSGHGSRRTAKENDEGSGKDSTIMPSDSGRKPKKNLDINDNQIHDWLGRLTEKTRFVTLIFDCCHSGTITRDAFSATPRAVEDDDRSLEEMGLDSSQLPDANEAAPATRGGGGWLPLSDRYVVMSGCRDDETSREFDLDEGERYTRNGALTFYLTKALLQAKPGSTYRDVFEIARQGVNTRFPTQHSQIEGTQDLEIFGVRDIEPLRYVPVASVEGDTVTLKGGAAHGLRCGSRWAVYPQGIKQTEGSELLGQIEIQRVGPVTAEATILERHGDIAAGARCVEDVPAIGQVQLKVDLSELPGDALAAGVDQSPLLAIAGKPAGADVRAYVIEPRTKASAGDPMPDIQNIEVRSWALVDIGGGLASPLHGVNETGVIETLIFNLETIARYRNALKLDNPDSDLDVEFSIFRKSAAGKLEPANGGDFVFDVGDCIALRVLNNEKSPVFLNLLDFDVTGKISLAYPRNSAGELIGPGRPLELGMDGSDLPVGLEGYSGDQGVQTLKAVITTSEADFSWLEQGATRSAPTMPAQLQDQFEAAYLGQTTRSADDAGDAKKARDDWKSINRSFSIRRKQS